MIRNNLISLLEAKFKDSSIIITGSFILGNFKEKSDIDVIVLSQQIAISYNEKIYFDEVEKYIDCLVIPKNRIVEEIEKSYISKSGALIRMIAKGEILIDKDNYLSSVIELCDFYYQKGKTFYFDEHEIKNKCIKASNAIDDLEDCENSIDKFILFKRVFEELGQLYLMANNRWESNGKTILAELTNIAPEFVNDFNFLIKNCLIDNSNSKKMSEILKKHLNQFHDFENQYSTRKGFLKKKLLSIEVLEISLTDYKNIINLLSYFFNKKYKLYIDTFSFEYHDQSAKAFLNIKLLNNYSEINEIEIFNSIKADILSPANSFITQNTLFNGFSGGEILNNIFQDYKNDLSYQLTKYVRKNKIDYKTEEVFGVCFLLTLWIYKILDKDLIEVFSNYAYEDILPSAYDIKALKSFEELSFEKMKIINHFKLRYESNRYNFNKFISDFLDDMTTEPESIFDNSSFLKDQKNLIKKNILDINGCKKEFFLFEYQNLNSKLESYEKANVLISYKKFLEISFNILGLASIDRAFIFYIFKNLTYARKK